MFKWRILVWVMLIVIILILFSTILAFSTNRQYSPQLIESDSALVLREGIWTYQYTSSASGAGYLYSTDSSSDVLTLNFTGTTIDIIYIRHPSLGRFAVEIDGTIVRTVNAYNEATEFGVVSSITYLADEQHVLRVYPAEGVIAIDAFIAGTTLETILVTATPNTYTPSPSENPQTPQALEEEPETIFLSAATASDLLNHIMSKVNVNINIPYQIELTSDIYSFSNENVIGGIHYSAMPILGDLTIIGANGVGENGTSLYPNQITIWNTIERSSGAPHIDLFHIVEGGKLTLYNVRLTNGGGPTRWSGGGIVNNGELYIYNSQIISNQSAGWGGGIHNNPEAQLTAINTEFINNRAVDPQLQAGGGSAIVNYGTLTAACTTFENNHVNPTIEGGTSYVPFTVPGGAIHNESSSFDVHHSNFIDNTADGQNPNCPIWPSLGFCPLHIRDIATTLSVNATENYWSNMSVWVTNGQQIATSPVAASPIEFGDYGGEGQACQVPLMKAPIQILFEIEHSGANPADTENAKRTAEDIVPLYDTATFQINIENLGNSSVTINSMRLKWEWQAKPDSPDLIAAGIAVTRDRPFLIIENADAVVTSRECEEDHCHGYLDWSSLFLAAGTSKEIAPTATVVLSGEITFYLEINPNGYDTNTTSYDLTIPISSYIDLDNLEIKSGIEAIIFYIVYAESQFGQTENGDRIPPNAPPISTQFLRQPPYCNPSANPPSYNSAPQEPPNGNPIQTPEVEWKQLIYLDHCVQDLSTPSFDGDFVYWAAHTILNGFLNTERNPSRKGEFGLWRFPNYALLYDELHHNWSYMADHDRLSLWQFADDNSLCGLGKYQEVWEQTRDNDTFDGYKALLQWHADYLDCIVYDINPEILGSKQNTELTKIREAYNLYFSVIQNAVEQFRGYLQDFESTEYPTYGSSLMVLANINHDNNLATTNITVQKCVGGCLNNTFQTPIEDVDQAKVIASYDFSELENFIKLLVKYTPDPPAYPSFIRPTLRIDTEAEFNQGYIWYAWVYKTPIGEDARHIPR